VSVALTGNDDYVEASLDAIDGWISSYDTSFDYVIRAGTKVRAAATYSPYMNIAIYWFSISYSANPIGGIAIVLISLNMAAQGLANVTFIYEGLRLLVLYLKVTIPTAFLPLAFIIRLIPFTRKVGNTLIALALAGIVFLPFSILLVESMHNVMGDGFPSPRISNMPGLDANPWAMVVAEPLCESATIRTILSLTDPLFAIIVCLPLLLIPIAGPGLFNACKPVLEYVVYPLLQVVFQIVMTVIMIAWFIAFAIQMAMPGGGYAGDVFDALYPFLMDVNNLVLMGYLDFVLIAIVTFAGARGLSSALGGEWYMAGVQRLI
jgi:hypothetical protein